MADDLFFFVCHFQSWVRDGTIRKISTFYFLLLIVAWWCTLLPSCVQIQCNHFIVVDLFIFASGPGPRFFGAGRIATGWQTPADREVSWESPARTKDPRPTKEVSFARYLIGYFFRTRFLPVAHSAINQVADESKCAVPIKLQPFNVKCGYLQFWCIKRRYPWKGPNRMSMIFGEESKSQSSFDTLLFFFFFGALRRR